MKTRRKTGLAFVILALLLVIGVNLWGIFYRISYFDHFSEGLRYFELPTKTAVHVNPVDAPVLYQVWDDVQDTAPYKRLDLGSEVVRITARNVKTDEVFERTGGFGHCYFTLNGRQGAEITELYVPERGDYEIRLFAYENEKVLLDKKMPVIRAALGGHHLGGGSVVRMSTYLIQGGGTFAAAVFGMIGFALWRKSTAKNGARLKSARRMPPPLPWAA